MVMGTSNMVTISYTQTCLQKMHKMLTRYNEKQ